MTVGRLARVACAITLFTACLTGQTVSSSLVGTVLDPASAVVPGASVTLNDLNNGSVRSVVTDSSGLFRFLNVTPGTYTVSVQVTGFKNLVQTNILVSANETRDVGKLSLALGITSEKISVEAQATTIQLAS